jgi:hypothetical protein
MARRDSQRPAFLLRSFLLPASGAKLSRELPAAYVVHAQNLDDPANAGVIVGDDIRVSLLKHCCPSLESPVLEF